MKPKVKNFSCIVVNVRVVIGSKNSYSCFTKGILEILKLKDKCLICGRIFCNAWIFEDNIEGYEIPR